MCGLLGWYFSRLDRRQIPLVAALGALNLDRGEDSWGYLAYPFDKSGGINYQDPVFQKDIGNWCLNVNSRQMRKYAMVMGHTRNATVGKPTQQNAHPFVCGSIIGMHNGAIRNHNELNSKYNRNFQVDSQHIFAQIDEDKPLKDLHGYGAITYVKKEFPQRMYFARWNGGVFSVADVYLQTGEALGVAWSSTDDALCNALAQAGFTFKLRKVDEDKCYFIEPNADKIPKVFVIDPKRFKYNFGTNYSLWEASKDKTDVEMIWCTTCHLVDQAKFHKRNNSSHNKPGSSMDGKTYSEEEKLERNLLCKEIDLRWQEPQFQTEGEFKGYKYKVIFADGGKLFKLKKLGETQANPKEKSTGSESTSFLAAPCAMCKGTSKPLEEVATFMKEPKYLRMCSSCANAVRTSKVDARLKIVNAVLGSMGKPINTLPVVVDVKVPDGKGHLVDASDMGAIN